MGKYFGLYDLVPSTIVASSYCSTAIPLAKLLP